MSRPAASRRARSRRLLEIVRELRDDGVSIIFITHRLNEIVEIADRVVVLRDGRLVGEIARDDIRPDTMISMMIGRPLKTLYQPPAITQGDVGLEIIGARTAAHPADDVSLSVRRGEILGLAGLIGAGRSELARAIFGVEPLLAGEIRIAGTAIHATTPGAAMARGIALVPEDRKQSRPAACGQHRLQHGTGQLGQVLPAGVSSPMALSTPLPAIRLPPSTSIRRDRRRSCRNCRAAISRR